jgi:broad specificity phosphatase PhoE
MADQHLILIKHSSPQVVAGVSPELWVLSREGQERCALLADRVGKYHPAEIFTSDEAKAIETGKLLAAKLSMPGQPAIGCREIPGLQEHDRSNVPHLRSSEFISRMELAFRKPNELLLGKETVAAAGARLESALRKLVESHTGKSIAVVSHGTVLAAWLGRQLQQDAYTLWRKMGLPSMAVLRLPGLELVEMVYQITP